MDGDIDDLMKLLEIMALAGQTLDPGILNKVDATDRVS